MYEFHLPDLGEGVVDAEITSWLVAVGQQVSEDDPLCEVDTDKAAMDIPCPVDGTVSAIHVADGERVEVGTLLVSFATAGAVVAAAPAAAPAAAADGRRAPEREPSTIRATPIARRVAADLGVDLAAVSGSGPRGSIREADVRAAAEAAGPAASDGVARREPLRGVRRRIAENLTRSHQEVPKVTVVEECDLTALSETRGDRSFVTFTLRAVAAGLKEFSEFNARLEDDEIVYLDRYDVGVAAQGPKGLVVPVVRRVDQRSVDEIDAEVTRLAAEARAGTLSREDLIDATFTVTNAGKLGGYFATPLVNPPEVAILGVHRAQARPVIRDGGIVVRTMALVSCSFDHRVTDGSRATAFLLRVIGELERGAPDA
jgi:pyruvate/2-oxoglutarate dehydrogenase complex dihydrolipoamide acyltransferase (E2) component